MDASWMIEKSDEKWPTAARRSSLTSTGTLSSVDSESRKLLIDLEPTVDEQMEHVEQMVSGMLEGMLDKGAAGLEHVIC